MKKIVTFVVFFALAFSLSAQFKTGMDFRTRAEMYKLYDEAAAGYDVPWSRVTDLRFKPWLSYTQNEFLTAKFVMEIGDIAFGDASQGGAIGTDGINVETKNLFLDITPNKENLIRLGLQPYKDFHGMLIDTDLAGISWKNIYAIQGKNLTSFLAWFVSEDDNESLVDETTYSFGNTEIIADFEYQINKDMKVGINNLMQFSRYPLTANVHETALNLYSAPYFAGTFDKFYVEAVIGANNLRPDNEIIYGDGDEGYTPESTGIAFSMKTKYDINDEFDARFNFLYRDGDGSPEAGWNVFYGPLYANKTKSYYNSGLEILTESGCGLDKVDVTVFSPFTSFLAPIGNAGIILPSVFVDYDITKIVSEKMNFINGFKLTMGLGYAATVVEMMRLGSDGQYRPETWIGTELDLKAQIKMFDDLYMTPYFAVLFPGEWYNYEGDYDHYFTKVGLSLKTKLK